MSEEARQDGTDGRLHSPLTPHLVCQGAAEAIEFYKAAFDATELIRIPGEDGKLMHACVLINGAPVMLVDEFCMSMGEVAERSSRSPKALNGTPVTIHLNVQDVDAVFNQAVAAGAQVAFPVQDMFWGDRYGVVEDPFGHHWSIATTIKEVSEQELMDAAKSGKC